MQTSETIYLQECLRGNRPSKAVEWSCQRLKMDRGDIEARGQRGTNPSNNTCCIVPSPRRHPRDSVRDPQKEEDRVEGEKQGAKERIYLGVVRDCDATAKLSCALCSYDVASSASYLSELASITMKSLSIRNVRS